MANRFKKDYEKIRRKIARDPELGKVPDRNLAAKYDVSKTIVLKVRNEHGVPALPKTQWNIGNDNSPARDKILPNKELVGQYSDLSVAEFLGIHRETVRKFRVKMGLPPSKKKFVVPLPPETVLLEGWRCIPERVGLTKNEWLRRNEDRA